ncbi:peptide deformylase [Spiroplasma platyhelix]|uniref:Peptide deformylase n=1 Tax=Spiroplasma platyhelix PALS-1 TaxID=1276218 RepID=A0A846U8M8_9MOLU|nr:peptide deformylase [Spiroplasma platyhelix]MBE4703860.1 Peptide deformylase 2 [Spiroplasma platyhelix PALS-1]NKE38233.1 peptide deformylase [Spiroplasma platyhelix PALS-1]UJB29118.1 peptide deformylase [Spiroplasma platyhelix PALS-1]
MLKLLQEETPKATWIVKDNKKSLLSGCKPVTLPLSKEDTLVMKKMIDWVRVSQDEKLNTDKELTEAIGIAAPQIGANLNMYYILLPILNEKTDKVTYFEHALINPKISGKSKQIAALKPGEACLSVDKKHEGLVPRSYKIHVSGYDFLKKKHVSLIVRGYEAIVFQHEQDHLEKKIYYHHINKKDPWFKKEDWIII